MIRAGSEGAIPKNTETPPIVRLIVFVFVFFECQTYRSDINENIDKRQLYFQKNVEK